MNQMTTTGGTKTEADAVRDFNIIDLLIILARHKKLIFFFPLIIAVVSAAISFALPDVYKASTKLLPPQNPQSGAAALLSQLGGAAGAVAGVTGLKNPSDMYIGMLKSRTVADAMITSFRLKEVYEVDTFEKARKVLAENTAVLSSKDGLINIDVEDEDRKRAANMANAYVAELVKLTKVLAVTEASQRRMFFERQLEQAKNSLAKAEMTFKGAVDTRGVISVDSDSRAIVETVGRLRAQISAKEIQLGAMEAFVTKDNQEFKRAQQELISLREELSKLENGRPALDGSSINNKQVGLENIKILRDVKYYQMLYELLAKQYEVARLDEAKDNAIIQVLDVAVDPERKSRPKRAVIILLATIAAFIFAVLWAFVVEAKKKILQGPIAVRQVEELKALARFK